MRRATLTGRCVLAACAVVFAGLAGCADRTAAAGGSGFGLQRPNPAMNLPRDLAVDLAAALAFSPGQSVIASEATDARGPVPAAAAAPANCKTVKQFDRVKPKMHRKAPAHLKPWLGHWGPGMWDGKLCHELVIEEIREDGTARVADLQGYYLPWNRWPTAFRREARFLEDGTLEVKQGRMGVSTYTLQDGVLHGDYSWGVASVHATLMKKR